LEKPVAKKDWEKFVLKVVGKNALRKKKRGVAGQ